MYRQKFLELGFLKLKQGQAGLFLRIRDKVVFLRYQLSLFFCLLVYTNYYIIPIQKMFATHELSVGAQGKSAPNTA
jgi:hypothetical protein